MSPKVSIVIPVLEHREELRACLASLDQQTEKAIEVIVIDDGSIDRIQQEDLDGFAFAAKLIRFEENRGAPFARNTGLDSANGEYIVFLDADAHLPTDALEVLIKALVDHPEASFAYPNFRFGKKAFRGRPFDADALREKNYIHTSVLLRKNEAIRFDESLKKFQDWDYFLQLAQQGKKGIWVDRELMVFEERKAAGMSRWLPSFSYDIPWQAIGWTPTFIAWYLKADDIIRTKHDLAPRKKSWLGEGLFFGAWLGLLFLATIIARIVPQANTVLAILVTLIFSRVTYKSPAHGFALMASEYVIGSKGGMLKIGADIVNDGGLGIRQLFFFAFLGLWFFGERWSVYWKYHTDWIKERTIYLLLILTIAYGVLRGFALDQPFVLADANNWGVLLLAFPLYQLIRQNTADIVRPMVAALTVGLVVNAGLSFLLFYIYSHDTGAIQVPVYLFIRRSGIGEITRIFADGSLYRVFIQSQIYWVFAFVIALFAHKTLSKKLRLGLLSIGTAIIVISLSRSFFLGVGAAVGVWVLSMAVDAFRLKNMKESFANVGWTTIAGIAGVILIAILAFFPIPPSKNGALDDALLNRFDTGEAAAQSRWILLPALTKEIAKNPILGSGFGKTVTYKSADPRVAATGKEYTTYAFEWGWHDLWLKLGAGVLVVLSWLLFVANEIRKSTIESDLKRGLIAAILALVVIHAFTPYVNHPLGILAVIMMEVYVSARALTKVVI
ncbi:MAG: glycosyltransferase family 2 protein [Candidatus Nomurabacteria bacterium]|nr:MAG: glycosyltransferase family 2 protein [Candidatus Nomurabacteria bacterium]